MKLCLLLLALVVSAFAQAENGVPATPATPAVSIDVLDPNEIDEEDLMLTAAVSDDELALEDEEIASIAEPSLKRDVEQQEEADALTVEEELLVEDEAEEDLQDQEDRELALADVEEEILEPSQKRQVVNANAASVGNSNGAATVRVAATGNANANGRFAVRGSSNGRVGGRAGGRVGGRVNGGTNATAALRAQIVRNQQRRRELNTKQHQEVRALRKSFAAARQALIRQQGTARRTLLQQQRNETTALHATQRADRQRLIQQQLATLAAATEAQRVGLRPQLRQQRDNLRQQHKQARETMQQLHTQQRQTLRLTLKQARENLRAQQTRERQALQAAHVTARAQLRASIKAENAKVRAEVRAAREARTLRSLKFRLASMTRALVAISNTTGLSANTTANLAAINAILVRLQVSIDAGNLTAYRRTLRNVTGPLLRHIRRLISSSDLAGTTGRRRIGALLAGARGLRGATHFGRGNCQTPRSPYSRGTNGTRTHGRGYGSNGVRTASNGARLNGRAYQRPGNRTASTGGRRQTLNNVGHRRGPNRGTNGLAGNRQVVGSNVGLSANNGLVANDGLAATNGVTNNGVIAANAVGDDMSVESTNAASSDSSAIPGWAVAVVVVASLATIALVVVAGLLVARMNRGATEDV